MTARQRDLEVQRNAAHARAVQWCKRLLQDGSMEALMQVVAAVDEFWSRRV